MRWFVEVSRVGESSIAEKYCVEAKQWQAALQEARKLRGDSGALSKFSIELLDKGYRAVDPSLKLRYLIDHAPADAPLSEEPLLTTAETSSGKLRAAESIAPTAFAAPSAVAAVSAVPRPASHSPPRPNSASPPRPASHAPALAQQLLVPDDPVPPAPRLPGLSPVPAAPPSPSMPQYELVRQRAEEPRAESPITYREVAYAVQPGATRSQVEALLFDRYQATLATIEDRPPGKFVQLAVFDHVFKRRPERPPLATFAWKDWRGGPVLAFPGFGEAPMGPMSQVPPAPASLPPPNGVSASAPPASGLSALPLPSSLAPGAGVSALPLPASLAPAAAVAAVVPTPSVVPDSAPVVPMAPVVLTSRPPEVAPAPLVAAPVVEEPVFPLARPSAAPSALEPVVAESPAVAAESAIALAPVVAEPAVAVAPVVAEPAVAPPAPAAFDLNFEATPPIAAAAAAPAATPQSSPDRERVSRPRLAVDGRRRSGEDLIGELFELMHELHFARDVAAGAEYVLSVLNEVLPCEGVLVHVFDINTGHFVVVRAKGPQASAVLLQRMPDQEPFAVSIMRSPRAVSVQDAASDARFAGPRWQALGVTPKLALCGAVQLGGRYLGLIELMNPQDGTPFHSSELNALDYICQQFAEFLSKKPIVLTADVVLARL